MRFGNRLGKIMPALAMAAALGLGGCDDIDIEINENKGVPLAELDMSGEVPTGVVLAGSDHVVITDSGEFTIDVEGTAEARERMRFSIEDGALAIHRGEGDWNDTDKATVNVAMPAPGSLVMAGSGTITTNAMDDRPEIVMAGSGEIDASNLSAERVEMTIAGSGTVSASGSTDRLELTVAGSGDAPMPDLQVGDAEITVAGSGNAAFSSDGRVEASIVGSGDIRVTGSARCEVTSIGSGDLICEGGVIEAE